MRLSHGGRVAILGAPGFQDTEATVYARWPDAMNNNGIIHLQPKTEHYCLGPGGTSDDNNKFGGYVLYIDTKDKALYWKKEQSHTIGYSARLAQVSAALNANTWYGFKAICYNQGSNVKLECWMDTTGGVNGGNWFKMNQTTDNGTWDIMGSTYPPSTGEMDEGAIRTDDQTTGSYFEYKWMSFREIIPSPPTAPPPAPPPPPPPPPPGQGGILDTDGVKILYPLNNAQGKFHHNLLERVGSSSSFDGDDILEMDIEGNATKTTSGGVTYWRCISREGSFQSGGTNWTSRPEWVSSHCNTPSGVSGAKSRGYLCNANDPKSLEATIIFKVTGIHDNSEEATMGVRGDDHSDTNEKTLQMKNFFPYGQHTSNQWGFEKTHPDAQRRAVTFVSPYNSSNHPLVGSNTWRGMKLAVWNINNNQGVHCEMWIDESPIKTGGGYNNNWKKVWMYEEQRSDTPTWGGPRQQFRVDMCDELAPGRIFMS